jgi:hypothetical protein
MNLKEVLKTLIAKFHEQKIDFILPREYFKLFGKEEPLDEWLNEIK